MYGGLNSASAQDEGVNGSDTIFIDVHRAREQNKRRSNRS